MKSTRVSAFYARSSENARASRSRNPLIEHMQPAYQAGMQPSARSEFRSFQF